MTVVPKYKRPAKIAGHWPGKFHVGFSHPGLQHPWKFNCPAPLCFYAIVAATEEQIDERIENHQCPWFGGSTTTLSWSIMSDEYLAPLWKSLDLAVDRIKGGTSTEYDKGLARGIANSLAVLMPPFFTTGDEIVNEALVRWNHRQSNADYETPGIGRLKWKRPDMEGDPNKPSWVTKPEYDAKEPPSHSLTEAEVTAIQAAKGFPVAMLASAYNTTEKVIKHIQES